MERCDVVIVGSRLAGATAAAHLAMAGRRVVVLDRSRFPSERLSTHLLFPAGVDELRRIGALEGILAQNPTRSPWVELAVDGVTLVKERWRAVGDLDYCMCVPRPVQDLELVRAARAAGADVRERSKVTDVLWRAGRAAGVRYVDPDGVAHDVRADLVIGADGRWSTVAAQVGAFTPYRASRNGRGLVWRYVDDPQADSQPGHTIYQWRDGDSLGFAFPSLPHGRILTLFMGEADEVRRARHDAEGYWKEKLGCHPAMAERLEGATNASKLRTADDNTAFFRASSGPGWALLGDAGHFKDPVIGQGQRDALWSGRTLAEAVAHRTQNHAETDQALRRWEVERDRECLPAYHFANIETVFRSTSPVLAEIMRRTGMTETPDLSDLFGRARSLPQVITVNRMQRGLIDALRGGAGRRMVPDALADLRTHLGVRKERFDGRFRSTRIIPGSDHPSPRPPGWKPAAKPTPDAAPATPEPALSGAGSGA